jgi:hypothetical protein
MKVSVTSMHTEEVGPVLNSVCLSLQNEFEELLRDSDIGRGLDQMAVIVTAVNEDLDLDKCRCISPVSLSSNENYVTGDKAKILTIRPTIRPTFIMQHSTDEIRKQILLEMINVISNIKMKRILDMFNQGRFVGLLRAKAGIDQRAVLNAADDYS